MLVIGTLMPLTYSLDAAERIVTILGDYAQPGEWRTLLLTLADDPAYRPGFAFLRDLRESAHPVDADVVVGIMTVVREFWSALSPRRVALLTRRDVDFPAMIAEALAEDSSLPMRAFSSYADAIAWLRER
jgi:hypothetical protein